MLRASNGPRVACSDQREDESCCPGILEANHHRAWCPSCAVHVCLACANVRGTEQDPYGVLRANCAKEASARRETIEGTRRLPPRADLVDSAPEPSAVAPTPAAPTEQQQRGIDRLRLLQPRRGRVSEYRDVVEKLRDSLPDARVRRVFAIDHEPARRRFELELELEPALRNNCKLLWHSTGGFHGAKAAEAQVQTDVPLPSTDPLDLIGARFPFDHTFANHGTYGTRALCFAEHAVYPDVLLPCRRSVLEHVGDGERSRRAVLPQVGDDILLEGSSAVYEVKEVGSNAQPSLCRLRQLHWNKGEAGAGTEGMHQLGDGANDTRAWATADVHYLVLADVALGECKDYGKEEPNIKATGDNKTDPLPREPRGCHSVSGTEQE